LGFWKYIKKASKYNHLLANNLSSEADGARTHNLRIDSPIKGFYNYLIDKMLWQAGKGLTKLKQN
jgi:hypothetical protein